MSRTNHGLLQTEDRTQTASALRLEAVARRAEKEERRNRNLQAKCQEFATRYGRKLALGALEPFSRAVRAYLEEQSQPRTQSSGRPHSFRRYALGIPPETIVLLTLQAVINGISMERSMVAVAETIGTLLDESCRDGEVWTTEVRGFIGLKCLELLEGSVPDLIHRRLVPKPGQEARKTEYHIFPTAKTLALITASPEKVGWAHPFFTPTVTIPDAYEDAHAFAMVSRVVNALQATPWTINRRVYEVALAEGAGEKNVRAASTMLLAKDFLDAERFYFPTHLDFRGRVYASPAYLNFQSDDLGASLLTFSHSEGKPLGSKGLYWLQLHGANLFGLDKMSIIERQSWSAFFGLGVHDIADNPLKDGFWKTAAKPWQFLAWCFEYAAALRCPGGPEAFISSLPLAIDGSCNGLQHLSAVMRDETGGRLVNLGCAEDREHPKDVYGAIADRVSAMMREEHDPVKRLYAQAWLNWPEGICRKAAKQIVMVIPYAANRFGATNKLIRDFLDEQPTCPWNLPRKRMMGRYFTDLAFAAVAELIPSSLMLRDWLQQVSDALSKANLPIEWRAPVTGFPVVQENYKYKTKTVQATYLGRRISPSLRIDSKTDLSPKNQRAAITANFIHSLDAAHLVLTMNKLLEKGITRFGCVHDSYVACAADMDLLAPLTRSAFVELHQGNLMESFFETACACLPEDARTRLRDSMPAQGGLKLEDAADSANLFS